jgi:hypothetical protein
LRYQFHLSFFTKSFFSFFTFFTDDDKTYHKAHEIAIRIITDHSHSAHTLSTENYKLFRNILIDQLHQNSNVKSWSGVKLWADLILKLLDGTNPEELEIFTVVAAYRIDALIQLRNSAEAVDCAQQLLSKHISTRTLIPFFKAMIFSDDISPQLVCQRYLAIQERIEDYPQLREENMERFGICCSLCDRSEIHPKRKNKIMILLLRQWIEYYTRTSCWQIVTEPIHIPNEGFFHICSLYITYCITEFSFMRDEKGSQLISDFVHFFQTLEEAKSDRNILNFRRPTSKRGFSADDVYMNSESFIVDNLKLLLETLRIMESIMNETTQTHALPKLGVSDHLKWIGDTVGLIGAKLVTHAKRLFSNKISFSIGSGNGNDKTRAELLDLGSGYLVQSEYFYSFIEKVSSTSAVLKTRVKSLLLAAASQLDYCECLKSQQSSSSSSELTVSSLNKSSEAADNKSLDVAGKKAENLAERASNLLEKAFDFADAEDIKLHGSAITLQFACYTVFGSVGQSEKFIAAKSAQLQFISIENFKLLIELAEASRRFSLEAIRSLLTNAIKAISHSNHRDAKQTGWLYRKLIEISSSRKQALERIQEFEALIRNSKNPEAYELEDIDQILAQTYNYAVSLIDLDQFLFAEQFLVKAINIVKYASENSKQWLSRMEVTDQHFLLFSFHHHYFLSQETNRFLQKKKSASNNPFITLPHSADSHSHERSTDEERARSPDIGRVGQISVESLQNSE